MNYFYLCTFLFKVSLKQHRGLHTLRFAERLLSADDLNSSRDSENTDDSDLVEQNDGSAEGIPIIPNIFERLAANIWEETSD